MNAAILRLRTELSKSRKEFKEYQIKAVRLINELLEYANPYFGDEVSLIKAEEIEQTGDELVLVKNKLVELDLKIRQITHELGED